MTCASYNILLQIKSELAMHSQKRTPTDFIKQMMGREVIVKLHEESEFTGQLSCLDGTLNIVLEKAEEHRQGKLVSKYNKVFLRGNNVLYILPKAARKPKEEAKHLHPGEGKAKDEKKTAAETKAP